MIGARTRGKNRARCEEKVLLVADASPSRLKWHARGWGGWRRTKRRFDHWREKRRGCTRRLALASPYLAPSASRWYGTQSGEEPHQSVESRSREPMRRRLTVIGARIHAPALAIVKRKIASVTLGISRIQDHAWVRREARRGNAAGSVPALAFEKRVFSLLDYDRNRCGNVITPRSRLRTWYNDLQRFK